MRISGEILVVEPEDISADGNIKPEIIAQFNNENIRIFDCTGCSKLKRLDQFPPRITKLNLTRCSSLEQLTGYFPITLQEVDLRGCSKFSVIEEALLSLPELNELNLSRSGIIDLTIPDGISPQISLLLDDAKKLERLVNLRSGLTILSINMNPNLKEIINPPKNLLLDYVHQKLEILRGPVESANLWYLLDTNPESFPKIKILEGPFLNTGNRPTTINLARKTTITTLKGPYPENLQKLNLVGCKNLATLEGPFPDAVQRIDLSGCSALNPRDNRLIIELERLERAGCEVRWPKQFTHAAKIEQARNRFTQIIANYTTTHQEGLPCTAALFDRFMTECLAARGSNSVADSVNSVLDILEKNPKHFVWVEELSKANTTDGCINQPVAFFNRLSALLSLVSAEKTIDKIEASRQLMVMDWIVKFIVDTTDKPGRGVEVEAGNLLLIRLHDRLLKDTKITKPWSNIPKNIAYAATIESWVDRNIDAAYGEILEVMNKPLSEVTKYLCEGADSHVWAQIAFPEKCEEVKKSHKATYEELGELYMDSSPIPKALLSKIDRSDSPPANERGDVLDRITKTLEIEIHYAIGREVHKLTNDAITPAQSVSSPLLSGQQQVVDGKQVIDH